jgi:hypothetical protein
VALVARSQELVDMENQGNISTTTWKSFLSSQYAQLWGIVAAAGLRYFETSETVTTTGAASYQEPASHLSTVGVERVVNAQCRRPLRELMAQEEYLFHRTGQEAVAWTLVDDQLYLYPTPPSGQTYNWRYIPQPPDLTTANDADLIDVVTLDGESFLLWGAAVRALSKQEKDTRDAVREREMARERVEEWASLRSLHSQRRRIVDEDDWGRVRYPGDWEYG